MKQGNSLEKQQLQVLPSSGNATGQSPPESIGMGTSHGDSTVPPPLEPAGQAALPLLHGVSPSSFPSSPSSLGSPLPWRNTELCLAKLSSPCPGPRQAPQQPHSSTRHQFYTDFCKRKGLRQSFPCKVPLTTSLITDTAEDILHDSQITA